MFNGFRKNGPGNSVGEILPSSICHLSVAVADLGVAMQTLAFNMMNLSPPPYDLTADVISSFLLLTFQLASAIGIINILIAQVR